MLSTEMKEKKTSEVLRKVFNMFYSEYQKSEALKRCIAADAEIAAGEFEEAPPMIEETWRLTQIMQEHNETLGSIFCSLNDVVIRAVLKLEDAEEMEAAKNANASLQ